MNDREKAVLWLNCFLKNKEEMILIPKPLVRLMYEALTQKPAADARPAVKAAWKRIDFKPCGHDYECSTCGWKNDMATHFCPNCGANMRQEKEEDGR